MAVAPFRTALYLSTLLLASQRAIASPVQSQPRGTLLELGPVVSLKASDLIADFQGHLKRDLDKRKGDLEAFGPMVVFQQMFQETGASLVPSRAFRYASEDSHGPGEPAHARTYSGRVFLPPLDKAKSRPMSIPLVVYQHATETRREFTPYFNKGDETLLGAMAAAFGGFAVAMPDGDGMGADPSMEMHHYCFGETASKCLIDCIRAMMGEIESIEGGEEGLVGVFDNKNYIWNGQIYIVGYSEGGYIAMAAVKDLSTKEEYKDISLTGAACMAGPFEFAKSTRELLAKNNQTPYDRPYIPAYFIKAWNSVYPDLVDFNGAVQTSLVQEGPSGSLGKWLDGTLGGDQISPRIQERLTGNKATAVPARAVLNPAWLARNLEDTSSPLSNRIQANDLVGGSKPWAPKVPVLLAHDPKDETVAFSNSKAAWDTWQHATPKPQNILELALGNKGSGHVGGAILAIPAAFTWIASGMPANMGKMAMETLKGAVRQTSLQVLGEGGADALSRVVEGKHEKHQSELPLSRIQVKGSYSITIEDLWLVVGKVKFYTLMKTPQFQGQRPMVGANGMAGYTRCVAEMEERHKPFDAGKALKDPEVVDPASLYLAVYPRKSFVGLTLKFTSATDRNKNYVLNIKEALKNKVANRHTGASLSPSKDLEPLIARSSFQSAAHPVPFINLP